MKLLRRLVAYLARLPEPRWKADEMEERLREFDRDRLTGGCYVMDREE